MLIGMRMARGIRVRDRRKWCGVVAVIKTEYREDGKKTTTVRCVELFFAQVLLVGAHTPVMRFGAYHSARAALASLLPGLGRRRLGDPSCVVRSASKVGQLF